MNAWLLYWLLTQDRRDEEDFDYLTEGDITFLTVVWVIFCVAMIALDIWMLWPTIRTWL